MENSAMISAPSQAFADKDATSKAEYKSPQGMSAHATPRMNGALAPNLFNTGRALRQTDWPKFSIQAGCLARHS